MIITLLELGSLFFYQRTKWNQKLYEVTIYVFDPLRFHEVFLFQSLKNKTKLFLELLANMNSKDAKTKTFLPQFEIQWQPGADLGKFK